MVNRMESILKYLEKEMTSPDLTTSQMDNWVEKIRYIFSVDTAEAWEAIEILMRNHDITALPQRCICSNPKCKHAQEAKTQDTYPALCSACNKLTVEIDKNTPRYKVNFSATPKMISEGASLRKSPEERIREYVDVWLKETGKGETVLVKEDEYRRFISKLSANFGVSERKVENYLNKKISGGQLEVEGRKLLDIDIITMGKTSFPPPMPQKPLMASIMKRKWGGNIAFDKSEAIEELKRNGLDDSQAQKMLERLLYEGDIYRISKEKFKTV